VTNNNEFWIYWHFITVTVDYNSPHIELLLNDVWLTNALRRLSHAIECTNQLPFIIPTQPEYKSPCRTVNCPLLFCLLSRESCVSNLIPGNDSFVVIHCNGNVISDPLLSNELPLRLHHSHVTILLVCAYKENAGPSSPARTFESWVRIPLEAWSLCAFILFVLFCVYVVALRRADPRSKESRRTRDHILLSQIRDFPFRCLLRLAGLRWRYASSPPHGILLTWAPNLPLLKHFSTDRVGNSAPLLQ
jgi:hypothetical protein